jgi:chromosome segregation ATPase
MKNIEGARIDIRSVLSQRRTNSYESLSTNISALMRQQDELREYIQPLKLKVKNLTSELKRIEGSITKNTSRFVNDGIFTNSILMENYLANHKKSFASMAKLTEEKAELEKEIVEATGTLETEISKQTELMKTLYGYKR